MNGLRSHHDEIQLLLRNHRNTISMLGTMIYTYLPLMRLNWILAIPHNSPELMVSSMSVRIGRPMEEALLSTLRIPLVTSQERIFLIMTSN